MINMKYIEQEIWTMKCVCLSLTKISLDLRRTQSNLAWPLRSPLFCFVGKKFHVLKLTYNLRFLSIVKFKCCNLLPFCKYSHFLKNIRFMTFNLSDIWNVSILSSQALYRVLPSFFFLAGSKYKPSVISCSQFEIPQP